MERSFSGKKTRCDQDKDKKDKKKGAVVVPSGSWTAGKTVIVAVILGGVATAIAALLGHREPRHSTLENCNAVSPFRCP